MAAIFCASCSQEISIDEPIIAKKMEIGIGLPSCKTALGEKDEDAYPNLWQTGDKISVNGKASDGLDAQYNGKASAVFTVEESSAPYCIAFPSSALSDYDNGTACITIPESQKYIEGTYDPKAFVMISKGEASMQQLNPAVSIFHLNLAGDATISSVTLKGEDTDALSGKFTTDFETLTASEVKNSVTMSGDAELPADFFVCIPAGEYTNISITVVGKDGAHMTKKAGINTTLAAGKMYGTPELTYVPNYAPVLTISDITSSTASIAWGTTYKDQYTIGVYSDNACKTPVRSYTVPASDACWSSKTPKFCVSGLQPGTKYYARVDNLTKEVNGEVAEFTTAEFTNVVPGTNAAAIGDILLAEDFGELEWDRDVIGGGAGWIPNTTTSFTPANAVVDAKQFNNSGSLAELTITTYQDALKASRLKAWGQEKNSLYIHPGFIKMGISTAFNRIITPALTNIPANKTATVEVTFTASRYNGDATRDALVGVVSGSVNTITSATKTNTLDIENYVSVTLDEKMAWSTYTVTLNGVVKGDRIVFGPGLNVAPDKGRMNISDIKVKLTGFDALHAKCTATSSSTLVFTWTNGVSEVDDASKIYTVELYSDKELETLVSSRTFDNKWGANKSGTAYKPWNQKQPVFVFPGLAQNTKYYFKVKNDTDNTESAVISAKTNPFEIVTMPDEITETGVVLAEDFSEFLWSYDLVAKASGYTPSSKSAISTTDFKTWCFPDAYNAESTLGKTTDPKDKGTRLEKWLFTYLYIHPGYCKLGTSDLSGGIATPAFTVPEGKVATVDVTVTYAKCTDTNTIGVTVLPKKLGLTSLSSFTMPEECKNIFKDVDLSQTAWATTTLKGFEVKAGDRIYFGHKAGTNVNNARSQLNDIKVTVTAINDAE